MSENNITKESKMENKTNESKPVTNNNAQVEGELSLLTDSMDRVSGVIGDIENRIESVLTLSTVDTVETCGPKDVVPLANVISSLNNKCMRTEDRLMDILSRIKL